MKVPLRSLHPMRVIHRHQSYIAVAVAIYRALSAAGRPVPIDLKSGVLADVKQFCASQLQKRCNPARRFCVAGE